jgi:VWFA-related protein
MAVRGSPGVVPRTGLPSTEESMLTGRRTGVLLGILAISAFALAQQATTAPQPDAATDSGSRGISLDVVVTSRAGAPVAGLAEQDFTVLDNKVPQKITSFQALGGNAAPVQVILVVDAVNTSYHNVGYERGEIDKFLRANGGRLAYPTALAVFTDTKTEIQSGFSRDGNQLSVALDQYTVGVREITRSAGFYGAGDRLSLSIKALGELAAHDSALPGRKLVLWISPGWPILSGPDVQIDEQDRQKIFRTIVGLSTDLRMDQMTLYSIDPRGTEDAGGFSTFYYQSFLKGVRKPDQVEFGNLALQVLATQTGGLVLNSSNDVAGLIEKAIADAGAYYRLSFNPAPGEPDEYHQIEVKVAKPGLVARTRTGYYSQP